MTITARQLSLHSFLLSLRQCRPAPPAHTAPILARSEQLCIGLQNNLWYRHLANLGLAKWSTYTWLMGARPGQGRMGRFLCACLPKRAKCGTINCRLSGFRLGFGDQTGTDTRVPCPSFQTPFGACFEEAWLIQRSTRGSIMSKLSQSQYDRCHAAVTPVAQGYTRDAG
jgi:hypothetical protein